MIKIHHLPRARGMRIVWMCEEMGLPYEIVPVGFPPGEAYRKLNPIGAIPFLEDEGGVAMNESIAMLFYLATQYGPTPLLPGKGDPKLPRVLQMTIFGEATLSMYGNIQIGAAFMAPEEHKQNWSVGMARERMLQAFNYTADMLGDGPYLAGDTFTIADISVGFAIGITPMIGLQDQLPKSLMAYHDRLAARPAYQRAAAK